MKFVTFEHCKKIKVGLVDPSVAAVWPLDELLGHAVGSMIDVINAFDGLKPHIITKGDGLSLADVRLLAPIPRPARNVICVGKNYREHAQEFAGSGFDSSAQSKMDAMPEHPIIFTKVPESVIASGEAILFPSGISVALDYEAELGVIIGKGGKNIARANAADHVWGYTIINDVTARDWQSRHKQWFLGKSFDTFCPMGPYIATADEVKGDGLNIRCWVNGELRQDANTKDLIFDIPNLIETISAGITLYPGDVIATGTPKGVGIGFKPPRFLMPGDVIKIEIDGLGALTNRVENAIV
jgi:2-keto-4-pentenoate hydratase/2-oxohepta-3-ene-1,7-dioic acid hydratase in catechol pathway